MERGGCTCEPKPKKKGGSGCGIVKSEATWNRGKRQWKSVQKVNPKLRSKQWIILGDIYHILLETIVWDLKNRGIYKHADQMHQQLHQTIDKTLSSKRFRPKWKHTSDHIWNLSMTAIGDKLFFIGNNIHRSVIISENSEFIFLSRIFYLWIRNLLPFTKEF